MPILRRHDLTQGIRALRRSPWYAIALSGVIALGMALSTTVFAIVDGALFKPLPYRDADRLHAASIGWSRLAEPPRILGSISPAQLDDWRRAVPDLRMTAFSVGNRQRIGVRDSVSSAGIDAEFFEVLGVQLVAGGFEPADFAAVTPIRPAVISHAFWRSRFGGDLSAIGRSLLDDTSQGIRVAGILPADFIFPFPAGGDWVPELLTPLVDTTPPSQGASRKVLVRLPPSASAEQAAARLTAVAAAWAAAHPPAPGPPDLPERTRILRAPFDDVTLTPIGRALTARVRESSSIVLVTAVALVLLACLNATSLALARIRDRWRDLAMRRSLGAGYVDLVRALAVENGAIVAVAALAGVTAAGPLLRITTHLIGDSYLAVLKPPVIDLRVLVFSAVVAVCCLTFVTLFAARAAMRTSAREALAEGAGTTRRTGGRRALLAIQVAVALVIAVAGALVAGSLQRVWDEDPGFAAHETALISMSQPAGASAAEIEALVAAVNRMPGVVRAGGAAHLLLEKAFNGSVFDRPPGVPSRPPGATFPIESVPVTHGFLEAAGLPVRDGRLPTDAELIGAAAVVVVSETVARQYWPGQRAVGQTLTSSGREFRVVGVVPDARLMSLDLEPQGVIYWPVAAMPRPLIAYVLVQLESATDEALATLVRDVRRQCPDCWFRHARLMADALADTIRPRRFSAWLFSSFGLAALFIAGTGIFGLVAMTTARRTREIGIRMTLGATRRRVIRQLLREQVGAVALGFLAGGLAAGWLVRFMATYLYEMTVYDPQAWGAAIASLLVIAALGTLLPAWRASRIDPVRALRVE
jgi:predicted permease